MKRSLSSAEVVDSGHRLPESIRRRMETLFDQSFATVRIHPDLRVLAGAVPARAAAWTIGENIYFAPGFYDAHSGSGMELLGHELAHVLQQRFGRVSGALNRDPALEAEAEIAGRRAATGQRVRIVGRARSNATPAIQCCVQVLPANRGAAHIALGNAAWHAAVAPPGPYPAIGDDTFIGQDKGTPHNLTNRSFLRTDNSICVSSANPANVTLRVSTGGNMAIEDADLARRQPKVFYATTAVVDESNQRLELMGSNFRLVRNSTQTITINARVLHQVKPRNVTNNTEGLAMSAAQNCDSLVQEVIGYMAASPPPRFDADLHMTPHLLVEYHVAKALLPAVPAIADLDSSSAVNLGTTMSDIARPYATAARAAGGAFTAELQRYGVNQYASPQVGEGFVSSGLICVAANVAIGQGGPAIVVQDHFHQAGGGGPLYLAKNTVWGSHWAGIVARDGQDVVTLENYARAAEDALSNADARYYFQMYDTTPASAQNWHTSWAGVPMVAIAPAPVAPVGTVPTYQPQVPGTLGFANPITMRVSVPDARWEAIAAQRFGAQVEAVKDDYNQLGGAATAHDQALAALKGLQYANAHLAGNRSGDTTRIDGWGQALATVYGANAFPQNRQLLRLAHQRILAVRRG